MSPKQRKRLIRASAKGNKLASIRMQSYLRKGNAIVNKACAEFADGVITYAQAQKQVIQQVAAALVSDLTRQVVRRVVNRLLTGGAYEAAAMSKGCF